MRKIEIICSVLILLGFILLVIGFPGKSIALVLGFGILGFVYQLFSFAILNGISFKKMFNKKNYIGISANRILASVFTGFVFAIASYAILFHVMFWPGGVFIRNVAIIGLLVVIAISSFKYSKNKAPFFRNTIIRATIFSVLIIVLSIISTDNFVRFQYRNDPEYAEAFLKVLKSPNDSTFQKEFKELKQKRKYEE